MIRDIEEKDKEQIITLAEMFYRERLERSGFHFFREGAEVHFDTFYKTPGVLKLCAVEDDGEIVGMIVGVASAIIFAKEVAMQEMVWYVKPNKRKSGLHLLREFEKRTAALGIKYIMMIGMTGDPVLGFYPKAGYTEIQQMFVKRLD